MFINFIVEFPVIVKIILLVVMMVDIVDILDDILLKNLKILLVVYCQSNTIYYVMSKLGVKI